MDINSNAKTFTRRLASGFWWCIAGLSVTITAFVALVASNVHLVRGI